MTKIKEKPPRARPKTADRARIPKAVLHKAAAKARSHLGNVAAQTAHTEQEEQEAQTAYFQDQVVGSAVDGGRFVLHAGYTRVNRQSRTRQRPTSERKSSRRNWGQTSPHPHVIMNTVDSQYSPLQTESVQARRREQARQQAIRTVHGMQHFYNRVKNTGGKLAGKLQAALRSLSSAVKGTGLLWIGGGTAAVTVILLVCLVAMVAGSSYGIFFAGAPMDGSLTVQQAVDTLTAAYQDHLQSISDTVQHDRQEITASDGVYSIQWQDVLAVFSAYLSAEDAGMSAAVLDTARMQVLRQILWEMNEVSYRTRIDTHTVEIPIEPAPTLAPDGNLPPATTQITISETVLVIHLKHKTPAEMAVDLNFNDRQNEQLALLCEPQYERLWAELLGGYTSGGGILQPDGTTSLPYGLQWPLPIPGVITSQPGYRVHPITGKVTYHNGTDIVAPEGTPILAAADGIVAAANGTDAWGGGYGYYVTVAHGEDLQTMYAHCSAICVTAGQPVLAGQVIGYVGSTGQSTGAHLHFSILKSSSLF